MKLLGRDIPARELLTRIEERLRTRGLPTSEAVEVPAEGVEPRVEPLTFNLHALEENADATRALPLQTHRGGVGQLVVVAKWAFRKSCQVFINEALGRQRVFNGHVRDSYAQLSAEVVRLRREVEQLRARQASDSSSAIQVRAAEPSLEAQRSPSPRVTKEPARTEQPPAARHAPRPRAESSTGPARPQVEQSRPTPPVPKASPAARSHGARGAVHGGASPSTSTGAAAVLPKPRSPKNETEPRQVQSPPTPAGVPAKKKPSSPPEKHPRGPNTSKPRRPKRR
ncbi:hypothetical protein HUA76_16000 [Myxococcus sp. CA056]|uniref:hypothetical protein n=1 Tax=Myxococcus sp. CA056 TaxID=2741740 RepID=UPI00157AD367|nr:hypothetical protein [Myxococcus sp. CA056]NTX12301.1 hypothetical protein [Myxococcus sp. CA056]